MEIGKEAVEETIYYFLLYICFFFSKEVVEYYAKDENSLDRWKKPSVIVKLKVIQSECSPEYCSDDGNEGVDAIA